MNKVYLVWYKGHFNIERDIKIFATEELAQNYIQSMDLYEPEKSKLVIITMDVYANAAPSGD